MNKQKIKEIEYDAMGDDTIKSYLPNAKIITYPELSKYQSIEEIIPNHKDYFILLYLQKKNDGHWTCLYNDEGCINFFCSYGSIPSKPLKWTTPEQKQILHETIPYLDILLSKTKKDVIYNPIEYQNDRDYNMSTCGRHVVFRLLTFLNNNISLEDYYKLMLKLKQKTKFKYDEIVSIYINKL